MFGIDDVWSCERIGLLPRVDMTGHESLKTSNLEFRVKDGFDKRSIDRKLLSSLSRKQRPSFSFAERLLGLKDLTVLKSTLRHAFYLPKI